MRTQHTASRGRALAAAAALFLCVLPAAAVAQEPRPGEAYLTGTLDISPLGDIQESVTYRLTVADWSRVRDAINDETFFKRTLGSQRADWDEVHDSLVCQLVPTRHTLEMGLEERGAVRNLGRGRWEYKPAPWLEDMTPSVDASGRPTAVFQARGNFRGLGGFRGKVTMVMPEGATDVRWDPRQRTLRYQIPYAESAGAAQLDVRFENRRRVMPTAYKVYALGKNNPEFSDQWVGKTVFHNSGTGPVRNLRVSYNLGDYDEQVVEETIAEILPGQTAVSLYYPVFKRDIAQVRSAKTSNLILKWRFEEADGAKQDGTDFKSTNVLGINEFIFSDMLAGEQYALMLDRFSNSPLLPCWVTKNDPPIFDIATTAIAFTNNRAGSQTPEASLIALEWLYNTMLVSDIVYKLPTTRRSGTQFDSVTTQTVLMPRDVLRAKGGTCIDLAIFYAAMCSEVGLDAYLMIIPGHCFPVVKLNGADEVYVGVEATMVGGGWNGDHGSWQQAYTKGQEELKEALRSPNSLLIDIKQSWASEVFGPELDQWDPSELRRLGLDRETLLGKLVAVQNAGAPVDPNRGREAQPTAQGLGTNLAGDWTGSGITPGGDKTFTITANIESVGAMLRCKIDAVLGNALVTEVYEGPLQGNNVVLDLKTRAITDRATNERRADENVRVQLLVSSESINAIRLERIRRDRAEGSQIFRLNRS